MTKRRKLSELISEETKQNDLPESEVSDSVTTKVSNSGIFKVTESQTNKVANSESLKLTESESVTNEQTNSESSEDSDLQTNKVPKYLTLVRKEARLREDQLDKLTRLTRSLNRKRRGTGERITDNTLIRVAVDLLLDKSDELKGCTEQEIKESGSL